MPDPLLDLENRRATVQMQIAQLGDMRSGSITETVGRASLDTSIRTFPYSPGADFF